MVHRYIIPPSEEEAYRVETSVLRDREVRVQGAITINAPSVVPSVIGQAG
jgi:hypothetical protein